MFPDYKYWKNRAPLRRETPSFSALNDHFGPKFRAANPDFLPLHPSGRDEKCKGTLIFTDLL
jgi:hypothetical protein